MEGYRRVAAAGGRERLLLGVGQPAHLSGPGREARADGRGDPRPRRHLDPVGGARLRRAERWAAPASSGARGGATLRAELDAAASSSPDAIGLISWNEFSENTHIEPSRRHGSRYLRLVGDVRGARLPERARLRLERAGGHGRQLRRAAARRTGPVARRRRGASSPFDGRKTPNRRLVGPKAGPPRLESPWSRGHSPWRWGLIAAFSAEAVADPVIMAAGDIACDPTDPGYNGGAGTADRCHQQATSDPARRHAAGRGAAARRHPVRQRHDRQDQRRLRPDLGPGEVDQPPDPRQPRERQRDRATSTTSTGWASPDGPAGPRGKGYYSFDLGAWHLVALNSNCSSVSLLGRLGAGDAGCEPTSPRIRRTARSPTGITRATARGTTAATPSCSRSGRRCRTPRRSSSCRATATTTSASPRWTATVTWTRPGGIRQFVVGTGGAFFTGGLGLAGAAQRGGPERHVRRPQAHASPGELRLAVRP